MDCPDLVSDGNIDCNGTAGRKQLRWDYAMDTALLDTLVEAAKQGHKQGNTWHNHVWKLVGEAVYEKTHQVVWKKHIESRLRTMKTEYRIFAELKERNGFVWDPVKQIISAPHEKWEELFKETGKYKGFRDRGPKWDFEKLCIIIGNDHADDDLREVDKDQNLDNFGDNVNLDDVGENVSVSTAGIGKRPLPSSSQKRQHDKKVRLIKSVKDMIDRMNAKMEQITKSVDPMSFTKTLHSEVMKTEGYSMEYLDSAFAILRRDPVEGEIFMPPASLEPRMWGINPHSPNHSTITPLATHFKVIQVKSPQLPHQVKLTKVIKAHQVKWIEASPSHVE